MPKVKKHLEGRTKEDRIEKRKHLGSLKSLTVQPKTRQRYDAAMNKFFLFLRHESLQLPTKRSCMDELLSEYLEHLWSSGEGRALAADTVAALQDSDPKLRGQLPGTWRLLKVWNQNEIPARAPPLPEVALRALVGYAIMNNDPMFALSLLIGFYGMLRTGEVLGLARHQVEVSSYRGPAILSLGMTKGGKRAGAAESITISVQEVIRRLFQWKSSKITFLVPSSHQWRQKFSTALTAVGLASFDFRPYSLRRGGATFWFAKHGSLDKLLVQGRWSAVKTARVYINEGLANLAEMSLPAATLRGFTSIYTRSISYALPSLEHTPKRSGPGGRGKRGKKWQFLWEVDVIKKCLGLSIFLAWRKMLGSTKAGWLRMTRRFFWNRTLGPDLLPGLAEDFRRVLEGIFFPKLHI